MWISWQVIRSSSLLQTERGHAKTDVCARVNNKCTSDTLSKDIDAWTDSFQSYRTKDRGFDHKLTFRDRSADVKRNLYNILMRDVSFTHNCQKRCCILFYLCKTQNRLCEHKRIILFCNDDIYMHKTHKMKNPLFEHGPRHAISGGWGTLEARWYGHH